MPAARATGIVARHELTLLRNDRQWIVMLVVLPFLTAVFLVPTFRAAFGPDAHDAAAVDAITGMGATFGGFVMVLAGFTIYREHGWSTWDRLRVADIPMQAILVGKGLVVLGVVLAQHVLLFACGAAFLSLRVHGSVIHLIVLHFVLGAYLSSAGLALAMVTRTAEQMNGLANVLTFVQAGLSGAFVPLNLMPDWARGAADVMPLRWLLAAIRADVAGTASVAGFLVGTLVPLAVAIAFTAVAVALMRPERGKEALLL